MCEANEQLQRAAYALEQMRGDGIWDYPKLKQLLTQALEHGGHG